MDTESIDASVFRVAMVTKNAQFNVLKNFRSIIHELEIRDKKLKVNQDGNVLVGYKPTTVLGIWQLTWTPNVCKKSLSLS